MSATKLNADRVFVVHLRSYGFVHVGRERLRTQVLKRTWEHIPGSTLYGAVAAALIRLLDPAIDLNARDLTGKSGDYLELLNAVAAREIRFTPLLPAPQALRSGEAYCRQAARLQTDFSLFHTTPHAPLSRPTEQIHGDQLFAFRTHRPCLDYYGFIFGRAAHRRWLETAFGLFPILPFGGKGKFALIEASLQDDVALAEFRCDLQTWTARQGQWARLLTPLVLPAIDDVPEPLSQEAVAEVALTRFRRYRVWRTGRYFNGEDFDTLGTDLGYRDTEAPALVGGLESAAMQAVPDGSRFRFKRSDDAVRWFIEGTGHPGWSYLGWGQVVIEAPEEAEV
jgi:hypothetical protein